MHKSPVCTVQYLLMLAMAFYSLRALATPTYPVSALADQPHPTVGIQFFRGTWSALLAEAKKQNKPIFVDVYTSWCGPCKLMAREAFPNKAVGDLFNASFLSYQIDAEKGEGIEIAKKFSVKAYPTSLYVSAGGELILRTEGYSGIQGLIDEAKKALTTTQDTKSVAEWDKEFSAGARDAAFLLAYLTKRATVGNPNPDALTAYLPLVPEVDWLTDANVFAISGNLTTTRSRAYEVLYEHMMNIRLTNQDQYRGIMNGVRLATRNDYKQAVANRDVGQLDRLVANERRVITALLVGDASKELEKFAGLDLRLRFYQEVQDWTAYKKLALVKGPQLMRMSADSVRAGDKAAYDQLAKRLAAMPDSDPRKEQSKEYAETLKTAGVTELTTSLNGLARTYAINFTDPADLKQALTWSERSLELTRSAASLDTYAQLLGKLGRKADAVKYEEEALATAKASGEDAADYEKTLASLKK